MNIVEVLRQAKPGQKIRRKDWESEHVLMVGYKIMIWAADEKTFNPTIESLTADDWEIVKQKHETWFIGEFKHHNSLGKHEIVVRNTLEGSPLYKELPENWPCKVTIEWEE